MSAFEADRFNHSRTSPRATLLKVRLLVNDTKVIRSACSSALGTALRPEKRLQHFSAPSGQNPALYLHPVIQLRMVQYLDDRIHCSGFRISSAIHQPFQSRMHQRAGAHRAGFDRDKQFAFAQAVVRQDLACFTQRDDLGVSGRIAIQLYFDSSRLRRCGRCIPRPRPPGHLPHLARVGLP